MNKANLKSYAPKARLDFIKAVTERANMLGITASGAAPAQVRGDVAIIDGTEWPAKVAAQRDQLITRMQREGFAQTCEAVAYTWFNRFAALRYMELHDYLGHGHRALSNSTGNLPDILTHAVDLAHSGANSGLPGLNAAKVIEMRLAGNRDGELYRMLLVAQCNALNAAMPFLFERIDDDTELLLPDNLLRTDSVIAKLVQAIPEEDWAEVEIIGWLYQFYISEKKDQVIGKVVKSEDIPAATQLFTPNWIVQYLVQNSVGRLWLMANPASTLASQWPYYIQPTEQTPEVQAQLDALIQTRMDEDGGSLNPETITVLDPACGSGHILVVAYDVLKAIYLERGYQARAIPRLILEKNLYGLDIDDRAAQMAGFALLMKGRADDRRLFSHPPKLNVLSLQDSEGLDAEYLARVLFPLGISEDVSGPSFAANDLFPGIHSQKILSESDVLPRYSRLTLSEGSPQFAIQLLVDVFANAKNFGSLIQLTPQRNNDVRALLSIVQEAVTTGDLYVQAAAQDLLPIVAQAHVLGMQFDAVVANPPYMGGKSMNPTLKEFTKVTFADSKSDLFAMFIERGLSWCKPTGFNSMVTMQTWMFLSSFEVMRKKLLSNHTLQTMAHFGARAFTDISGEIVQTSAFVFQRWHSSEYKPTFFRLISGQEEQKKDLLLSRKNQFTSTAIADFKKIPGAPLAYWVDDKIRDIFSQSKPLGLLFPVKSGMSTTNNARFLRLWSEIDFSSFYPDAVNAEEAKNSGGTWFPYKKGGEFRKWAGNDDYVLNWRNDGEEIKLAVVSNPSDPNTTHWSRRIFGTEHFFLQSLTWTKISSSSFSVRYSKSGSIFSDASNGAFPNRNPFFYLGYLNSNFARYCLSIISPTLNSTSGDISRLPIIEEKLQSVESRVEAGVQSLVALFQNDWDNIETSWGFSTFPLISAAEFSLQASWETWKVKCNGLIVKARLLEEQNNVFFTEAYGLQSEFSPDVPEDQIALAHADREKDCQRLISYAIGCMLGRYSLDKPGLVYARTNNVGFDASLYARFPADADGIVPLTDERWFTDDGASRVRQFLLAVWGEDTLEENMAWLAESLGAKASEIPNETIRRYLADKFFKDHLQTYKKRPIYWLFSSGKQGAFQALVYLHRYTEGTLARLRAEYVVPLIAKVVSRLDMLAQDVAAASSAASRTKLQKQIEALRKKQIELLAYDEKLRHYADMRVTLDLDDGVKVNYGKFGDLLDGVKLVIGGAGDD